MSTPLLTKIVSALPDTIPFVGPETQERARGRTFAARLGANESVFGPSPSAIEAMARAASDAWMYGDPETQPLRGALADQLGVGVENVLVGEGIDGLLGYAVRMATTPGDAVVTSLGAYPTFNYHVAGYGGRLHAVPYSADKEDLTALSAAAAEHDARLLYVANPDNPMGSWWSADDVSALMDRTPARTILCLDEAYIETAPEGTAPPIDAARPNVLRFRTFSKAMGLAGLRVGYVIGPAALISGLNRIRNHFGVGRVAQAGALAALEDRAYLSDVVDKIAASRARISEIASSAGAAPLRSAANFVTIDCGADGDFARAVLQELIARDVFVRMPGAPGLDRCIRVSCGREEDLRVFAEAFPGALAAARGAR